MVQSLQFQTMYLIPCISFSPKQNLVCLLSLQLSASDLELAQVIFPLLAFDTC